MEKIKVNLRYKTFNKIIDECLRLEFLKNDGTINKNAYICTLLINFYPYIAKGDINLKVNNKSISI